MISWVSDEARHGMTGVCFDIDVEHNADSSNILRARTAVPPVWKSSFKRVTWQCLRGPGRQMLETET